MSRPSMRPWWQSPPALITGSIAALGALGTFIVKSADYIKLPDAVAAQEQRNDTQDDRLNKLITLQEYYQQSQQIQQPSNRSIQSHVFREWDSFEKHFYCCNLEDRNTCYEQNQWFRCD